MKILRHIFICISMLIALNSCKCVNYYNYVHASSPVDHKLKNYKIVISELSFRQAFNSLSNGEVVKIPDQLSSNSKTNLSSDYYARNANLSAKYLQDDIEKNLISKEDGQTENGIIHVQVVQSKESSSLKGLLYFNACLLHLPMLLGVPYGKFKLEQTIRFRIYNKDGEKIIDLKGNGSADVIVACYYGYGWDNSTDKIIIETLSAALEDIKSQLRKSSVYPTL